MIAGRAISRSGGRSLLWTVALLMLPVVPVVTGESQDLSGTYMEQEIVRSEGPTRVAKIWLAPERVRIDQEQGMSMIWVGGPEGAMTMVMHQQKQYIQIGAQTMKMAAGLVGKLKKSDEKELQEKLSEEPPRFVPTGATQQIGPWNAREFRIEAKDFSGEATIWFSEDVDADLRRVIEDLSSSVEALNNPALSRFGGGIPSGELIMAMKEKIDEMELPAGFPVQIVVDSDRTTTVNLKAIEQGPIDSSTFQPPEGYSLIKLRRR
ncbi:MAG: hypothetical protein ACE5HV_10620 [Acidobacteriota bacterium]